MTKYEDPVIKIHTNIPLPETRGRPKYDEHQMILRAIYGLKIGVYKNYTHAATMLEPRAARIGSKETRINRLRKLFSKAWHEYSALKKRMTISNFSKRYIPELK